MTTPFLKKLAELDEGATAGDWVVRDLYDSSVWIDSPSGSVCSTVCQRDTELICLLRNNSRAIRQLVEAAEAWATECRDDLGHDKVNLTWLCQALAAFKGE